MNNCVYISEAAAAGPPPIVPVPIAIPTEPPAPPSEIPTAVPPVDNFKCVVETQTDNSPTKSNPKLPTPVPSASSSPIVSQQKVQKKISIISLIK